MIEVIFTNDNATKVLLPLHKFTDDFRKRDNHEVYFRRVNSYLIKNNYVNGNVIDLGAWIGDNTIPWALQLKHIIYAIDPSPENITYINNVASINNLTNVKTIQTAISNRNEIVSTTGNINHCSFMTGGNVKTQAVTLDYLLDSNKITNISLIHLDVEGFEDKVIAGSLNLIRTYYPIITFEQHLNTDDYINTSLLLFNENYNIYMINEVLLGCFPDCRNFLAVPKTTIINIDNLQLDINKNIILSVLDHDVRSNDHKYKATIYGTQLSNDEYNNIKSLKISNNTYVFAVHDDNCTKMINISDNEIWLGGKYVNGKINLLCQRTINDAWNMSNNIISSKKYYNIKNICKL